MNDCPPRISVAVVFAAASLLLLSSLSIAMAEEATVQIVYVQKPDAEEHEAFNIRTLAAVLGSDEAARDAVIYHYKHASCGFSAKLTPKQIEELSKQPGVLQVVPSRTYSLHGSSAPRTMGLQ